MIMIKYRISKYNPIYRDTNDTFLNDEWTSVSDIGKKYNNKYLCANEYLLIENKYIEALKIIMKDKDIKKFIVKELEKEFTLKEICNQLEQIQIVMSKEEKDLFNQISENYIIKFNEVDIIIKLLLRELLWCKLVDISFNYFVEIGYDYYMYINCSKLSDSAIIEIQSTGLFIEEFKID